MKTKVKNIVWISMALLFTVSVAIGETETMKPIQQETADRGKVSKGRFSKIELINEVVGIKVAIKTNENGPSLVVGLVGGANAKGELDYSVIKGGFTHINWLQFIVRDIKTNQEIARGEVELDWITKDKAAVLKEVINKLKALGVTATVEEKETPEGVVLVITIKEVGIAKMEKLTKKNS